MESLRFLTKIILWKYYVSWYVAFVLFLWVSCTYLFSDFFSLLDFTDIYIYFFYSFHHLSFFFFFFFSDYKNIDLRLPHWVVIVTVHMLFLEFFTMGIAVICKLEFFSCGISKLLWFLWIRTGYLWIQKFKISELNSDIL